MTHALTVRAAVLVTSGLVLPLVFGAVLARTAEEDVVAERTAARKLLAESVASVFERRLHEALDPVFRLHCEEGTAFFEEQAPAALRNVQLASRLFPSVLLADETGRVVWESPPGTARPESLRDPRGIAKSTLAGEGSARHLVLPLRDAGGAVKAFAGFGVPEGAPALAALLPQGSLGPSFAIELVEPTGTVVARAGPAAPADHAAAIAAAFVRRLPTSFRCVSCGAVATFAPVGSLPFAVVVRQNRDDLAAPFPALATKALALIPLFVLVGAFFSWGAARSLRAPLVQLDAAAARIASGDLATPVQHTSEDEMGRLARSLETMRSALAEKHEVLEGRVRDRTQALNAANEELRRREADRLGLLRKVIAAQEEERRRLARELHDETCQTVTALAVSIDGALGRADAGSAPGAVLDRHALEAARDIAGRTLDGLHRLIFDLRPSQLDDLGLVPALRGYAESRLPGLSVWFETEGFEERLPPHVETAVFRAVQEALSNVARHAGAENVFVEARLDAGTLTFSIDDDGCGFDPASVARPSVSGRGLGLLGMRERIDLLGGTVSIDSSSGEGTCVRIEVPVPRST